MLAFVGCSLDWGVSSLRLLVEGDVCFDPPSSREAHLKELEVEIQELKSNISQLHLERTELITKVHCVLYAICTCYM